MEVDRNKAWKTYAGGFAWPTVLLWLIAALGWAAAWVLALDGRLSLAWGFVISTVCCYVFFTPAHEAVHWSVSGTAKKLEWLNELVGWSSASILLTPYQFFRLMHLRHHSRTNDPAHDPDAWIASSNPVTLIFKAVTMLPSYYYHFFWKPNKETREQTRATVLHMILIVTAAAAMIFHFGWRPVVFLWLLPAFSAVTALAFVFDWVPHHPHRSQERFRDTRVVLFPGLKWLMIYQNYHLMHHLFPAVPFYNYVKVFEAERELLAQHEAPILDLVRAARS